MVQKITLALFTSLLLCLTLASASVFTITNLSYPTSVSESSTLSFTYNVTYTGTSESMDIDFSDSTVSFGSLTVHNATGLNGSAAGSAILSGTVSSLSGHGGENLIVTLNGTTSGGARENVSFTVSITEDAEDDEGFCEYGEVGDLEIADFNIDNYGTGDDEEWNLFDEISIEVEIENTNDDDDVDDVIVEIKILDESGDDVTNDFDLDDEKIDVGRIKDGESEIATFKINEVPADLEEGKYQVYIKAYSEDDEDLHCVDSSNDLNKDDYQEVEVVREEDPAVIVKEDILSVQGVCGEEVVVSFNVYNLGSDEEDSVLVTLANSELGLMEKQVIENLRSGKSKEVTFVFSLPEGLSKSSYNLGIMTYFDYDDGDEYEPSSYDEDSDEIDRSWSVKLETLSCQEAVSPSISAQLDSDTVVGKELVIRVSLENNAEDAQTFVVSASNYESWASLESVTPQTLTLNGGQSGEAVIKLMPQEAGVNSFVISTTVDGEVFNQPVSVNIEEKSATSLFGGMDKITLYLLIGIVVLVILIIIILIVKLARK